MCVCVCVCVCLWIYVYQLSTSIEMFGSSPRQIRKRQIRIRHHMCLKLMCFYIILTLSTHLVGNPHPLVFWEFLTYINDQNDSFNHLRFFKCHRVKLMHSLAPGKSEWLLVDPRPPDWDTTHSLFLEREDRFIWPDNLSFYRLMIYTKIEIYISM